MSHFNAAMDVYPTGLHDQRVPENKRSRMEAYRRRSRGRR